MARDDARTTRDATDRSRPDHAASPPPGTERRGVRPVANSLTVVGTLLVILGGWSILRSLGVVPDALANAVSDWWGAALVIGGGWLFWRGRRATGAVLALIGALNLTVSLVPGRLIAPVLLITVGIVLVIGALGGRRWIARPGEALVDEVRGALLPARSARSVVALFDEATGVIDANPDEPGAVEVVAVFGDVKVTVPYDVAVELRQTAVFGDVRAPEPPTVAAAATVQVRATAVFGDVRIERL